ncbi:putative sulfate exporter family transporter [Allocoprobacillus halotolerans]|uniref:Sulfate exporter family transporter n=1 Tax=Allocoprobacillus halotolerans TaxID=2944914 RepID=A0ABY5I790_9FIRM|nr:putative sulfate exporter family transporter [Allocoprobacillus halotolerans]UTY40111.1 putative sulfate exporter family transporter [Allocoprobacillus halotolerans]
MKRMKEILPGFIVCLVIGLLAQQIAKFFPSIGAALFAIGIGMLAGNTFLNKEIFNIGTKFSESRLLEYSIVLTGLTLQLTDIMGIGFHGVGFIALQMICTIAICYFIGRRLKFTKKFSLLMCAEMLFVVLQLLEQFHQLLRLIVKIKGFPSRLLM